MKFCSVSSASASVSVTRKSKSATVWVISSAPRVDGLEKCPATRLRIEVALPT